MGGRRYCTAVRRGINAPSLWLYNDKTNYEVDFEVMAKRGLLMTVHSSGAELAKHFSAPLMRGEESRRSL